MQNSRSLILKDLDIDFDGFVNEMEFLAIFESSNQQDMSHYFNQDLDSDNDGLLDLEELSQWIDPSNFVPGRETYATQICFYKAAQLMLFSESNTYIVNWN